MKILTYKEFLAIKRMEESASSILLEFDKTTYFKFFEMYLGYSPEFRNLASRDTLNRLYEFLETNQSLLYLNEESFLQKFQQAASSALEKGKNALSDGMKKFLELAKNVKTFLQKLIDEFKKVLPKLWDKMVELNDKLIKKNLEKIKETIKSGLTGLSDKVKETLKDEINYLKDLYNYFKKVVSDDPMSIIKFLFKYIIDMFKKDAEEVVPESYGFKNYKEKYTITLNENFIGFLFKNFNLLNEDASVVSIAEKIKEYLEKIPGFKEFEEFMHSVTHNAESFLVKNTNKLLTGLSKFFNKLFKAPGPKVFQELGHIIGKILNFLGPQAWVKSGINEIVKNIASVLFTTATTLFPHIDAFFRSIKILTMIYLGCEIITDIIEK